jgi:sialidase-1
MQHSLDDVPAVQASVLQLGGRSAPLLFSGPSVPTARRAMAIWRSTDGGATFTKALTLSRNPAAYSDLVQLRGGKVGILYETGATGMYDSIAFRRIPVADLD